MQKQISDRSRSTLRRRPLLVLIVFVAGLFGQTPVPGHAGRSGEAVAAAITRSTHEMIWRASLSGEVVKLIAAVAVNVIVQEMLGTLTEVGS